jgi:hypothetical protein
MEGSASEAVEDVEHERGDRRSHGAATHARRGPPRRPRGVCPQPCSVCCFTPPSTRNATRRKSSRRRKSSKEAGSGNWASRWFGNRSVDAEQSTVAVVKWSGRLDSNQRPSGLRTGRSTGLSHAPTFLCLKFSAPGPFLQNRGAKWPFVRKTGEFPRQHKASISVRAGHRLP